MELLKIITVWERWFVLILLAFTVYFVLRILSRKNFLKTKDGIEIVESIEHKPGRKEYSLEPTWEKTTPNGKIGFYSFGNCTKFFGKFWNSKLDVESYNIIRSIITPEIYISFSAVSVKYDNWIFDIRNANCTSGLISVIIDKSKQFKEIIVVTQLDNTVELKPLDPAFSNIQNVKVVVE